jgi:hypothetical protein
MENHIIFTFIPMITGRKIGTMTTTIGTHSKGQPRIKQTVRIPTRKHQGGKFQESKVLAMKDGVPIEEKTTPMNVEAARRTITMLVVSAVRKTDSFKRLKVSFPFSIVTITAPRHPRAAPSVGVATPVIMVPSVAKMRTAGGRSPRKNSRIL